jgi:hypothetical protein
MPSQHRVHHALYQASKVLTDPGNGGTILVTEDLQICEMVSAAAETRILANPTKSGIRFVLRLMTDGGDVVVTASNGFNNAGESKATFNDASDLLNLISVETATRGVFRWQIMTRRIAYAA